MNRHTVTVVRPGRTDYLGKPTPGAGGAEFDLADCILAPRGSSEVNEFSQTVLSDLTMFCPPGADVRATDLVRWDGRTYTVQGTPSVWDSPFSDWTPGQQVALTRVEG